MRALLFSKFSIFFFPKREENSKFHFTDIRAHIDIHISLSLSRREEEAKKKLRVEDERESRKEGKRERERCLFLLRTISLRRGRKWTLFFLLLLLRARL